MLFSVGAAVAIIINIAGSSQFTHHFVERQVGFTLSDDIGGLRPGDEVRLGGLKIGTVSKISFLARGSEGPETPPGDRIIVTMHIPDEYQLNEGARVGIETTLTGVTAMNISDLGDGQPMGANAVLVGEPDALTSLKNKLAAIVPKVDRDLDDIHSTLAIYSDAGQKIPLDIHSLAADLHLRLQQVSHSATGALDSIHDWLGPSTGDFHQTVANARDITAGLKKSLPTMEASAQQLLDHLNKAVADAQVAIQDLKPAAANIRDTVSALRSVVIHNQGRLDEIVTGLKRTADNLSATSVEVRRSPWRLLYKPTADEMANLNLYDAARQFADGANDLSDAAVALRDALNDKQSTPQQVEKLYGNLEDQFQKFQGTENDLWKQVRQ